MYILKDQYRCVENGLFRNREKNQDNLNDYIVKEKI